MPEPHKVIRMEAYGPPYKINRRPPLPAWHISPALSVNLSAPSDELAVVIIRPDQGRSSLDLPVGFYWKSEFKCRFKTTFIAAL